MSHDPLVPCGGCHRHVRANEAACPFCAQPLADVSLDGIVPDAPQRLSRAGVLAFAAAFLSTACPSQPGPAPTTGDVGMMQTIYGGPPPMPTPPTPPAPPATPDASTVIPSAPIYGGPPPVQPAPPEPPPPPPAPPTHHRPHARETPHPVTAPAYGLPPRPDPGSMVTRYGAPPRPTDG